MESSHDQFLTCKICCRLYNDPKILPCVHTFCLICIQKLAQTSTTADAVFCPECKQSVAVSRGTITDLKQNVFINGLIEVVKVKSNKDVECTACNFRGKSSPAESRCLDCGDYLCPRCSDGHNASSATWNQNKVLLEDIKTGTYDKHLRILHRITCSEHQSKVMKYYCTKCQIPTCILCIYTKHYKHKYVLTNEAVTDRKSRLNSHLQAIREKVSCLENEEKQVHKNISGIDVMESTVKKDIDKQVATILAKTQQQKDKALKIVDDIIINKKQQYNSQLANINRKQMIKHALDEEILMLEDVVISRLKEFEDMPLTGIALDETALPNINIEEMCSMNNSRSLNTDCRRTIETSTQTDIFGTKLSISPVCSFVIPNITSVTGMTVFNKTILLSNYTNEIMQISTTGDLLNTINTDDVQPRAIAKCQDTIGVICSNYLFVYSTTGKRICKNLMSPDAPTQGNTVANFNNEGYIVGRQDTGDFRMYDTSGRLQNKLSVSVSYPLISLSVNQIGNITTCEWGNNSVRVLLLEDDEVTVSTTLSLRANDACTDSNGFIYTLNSAKDRLSIFDKTGTCLLYHITRRDGMERPVYLALDDEGLVYVVNQRGCINIYSVNLE